MYTYILAFRDLRTRDVRNDNYHHIRMNGNELIAYHHPSLQCVIQQFETIGIGVRMRTKCVSRLCGLSGECGALAAALVRAVQCFSNDCRHSCVAVDRVQSVIAI